MAGPHSGLDPTSGPPGPPGVCAAASLQVEEDDEDEDEDEERPGDLLEMEAATAAAAAETRPTPGGALSRGSPAWFKKSDEVTRPGLPGAAPAAPSTRFPLLSRLVRGRVPPEARAGGERERLGWGRLPASHPQCPVFPSDPRTPISTPHTFPKGEMGMKRRAMQCAGAGWHGWSRNGMGARGPGGQGWWRGE